MFTFMYVVRAQRSLLRIASDPVALTLEWPTPLVAPLDIALRYAAVWDAKESFVSNGTTESRGESDGSSASEGTMPPYLAFA